MRLEDYLVGTKTWSQFSPPKPAVDVQFQYWSMDWDKLALTRASWLEFIATRLKVPFKVNYFELTFWQSLTTYGCGSRVKGLKYNGPCSFLNEKWHKCNESMASNRIIHALVYNQNIRLPCNGAVWSVNSSVLCVNCSPRLVNTSCPIFDKNYTLLAPMSQCERKKEQYTPKFATVLSIATDYVVPFSVPVIRHLNLTAGRANITAAFAAPCYPPGCKFSCQAFPSGTMLFSSSLVLNSPFSTFLGTDTNITSTLFEVKITSGLLASKAYDVYCLSMDLLGNLASFKTMKKTLATVKTACCRTVGFTSAPRYLFSDGPNRLNNPPFKYALSSSPDGSLKISVSVSAVANSSSSSSSSAVMVATPKSTLFSSTLQSLTGSFIFPVLPAPGLYIVAINVTGSDAAIYRGAQTSVMILSSALPIPAPVLKNFVFDSNGASALATFDSASELVNASVSASQFWSCSLALTFSGASKSKCSWMSLTSIRVYFPSFNVNTSSLLVPGDSVSLKNATIRAKCLSSSCRGLGLSTASTVVALPPIDLPVAPTIAVSVPRYMGLCDNFTFDATSSFGNGGRPWKAFKITISAAEPGANVNVALIQARLNMITSISTATVVVPGRLFNISQVYNLGVSLSNYLGGVSTAVFPIQRNSTNLPLIAILGPKTRVISSSDPLLLSAMALPSACGGVATGLAYRWKAYKEFLYAPLQSSSMDPRKMMLPARALISGHTYRFSCTATDPFGQFKEATVDVIVVPAPITVVIQGGQSRSVPRGEILVLDGSTSVDLDAVPGTSALTFQWNCTFISDSLKYGESCDFPVLTGVGSATQSILRIPRLRLSLNETYSFTLQASAGARFNSSSVSVSVSDTSAAAVSVDQITSRVNAGQRVLVAGHVSANISILATWNLYCNKQKVSSLSGVSLGRTTQIISEQEARRSSSFTLGIQSGFLEAGKTYAFRLIAVTVGSSVSSYSEMSLTINSPPISGYTSVSPKSGSTATTFVIRALNWVDDASDYPLLYQFAYLIFPTTDKNYLGSFSEFSSVSTALPSGIPTYNSSVQCVGYVKDFFGATTNATATAAVARLASTSTVSLAADLSKVISASLMYADTDALARAVNIAASVLNFVDCSRAPNCKSLRREGCFSRANTCGSCLAGFKGILGSSNTACRAKKSKRRKLFDLQEVRELAVYSPPSATAAICTTDDDCNYGSCKSSGYCSPFLKTCSSATTKECSGHGTCVYMSMTGKPSTSSACLSSDPFCYAVCACINGYGGEDCSLQPSDQQGSESMRMSMCRATAAGLLTQDVSDNLIFSTLSTLTSAFNPYEVVAEASVNECAKLLVTLGSYAKAGYLGVDGSPQKLADAISKFIDVVKRQKAIFLLTRNYTQWMNSSTSKYYYGEMHNKLYAPTKLAYIEPLVQNLVDGIHAGMFAGETDHIITSSNVRITLSYSRIDSYVSKKLSPPATDEESLYGVEQPSINFPQIGFGSCGFQASYTNIYVSIATWGFVPFQNSMRLLSSMMSYTVKLPKSQYSAPPAYPYFYPDPKSFGDSSQSFSLFLPFRKSVAWGSFGGTLDVGTFVNIINKTMPSCSFYRDNFYNKCVFNQTRSPFTPLNVTFTLTDSYELCPPAQALEVRMNSAQRILESTTALQFGAIEDIITHFPFYDVIYFPSPEATSFMSLMTAGMAILLVVFVRWDFYDFDRASVYLSNRMQLAKSSHFAKFKDKHAELIFGIDGVIKSLGKEVAEDFEDSKTKSELMLTLDGEEGNEDGKPKSYIKALDVSQDSSQVDSKGLLQRRTPRASLKIETLASNLFVNFDDDDGDNNYDVGDSASIKGAGTTLFKVDLDSIGDDSSHVSRTNDLVPTTLEKEHQLPKFIVDLEDKGTSSFHGEFDFDSVTDVDTDLESVDSSSPMPSPELVGFFQQAIHLSSYVATVGDPYIRAAFTLAENHDLWKMFTPWRSFVRTRSSDYLHIFSKTLFCLLFVTAFFDAVYPANYSCESRIYTPFIQVNETQKHACLKADAPFHFLDSGLGSECVWNKRTQKSSTCTRQPPPDYFMFYYFAALLVTIAGVIPSIVVRNLLKRVCDKRPRLEDVGLDSQRWLGAPLTFTVVSKNPAVKRTTALGSLFHQDHIDAILGKKSNNVPLRKTARSATLFASPIPTQTPGAVDLSKDFAILTRSKYAFYDVNSSRDEAEQILQKIKAFIFNHFDSAESSRISDAANTERLTLSYTEVMLGELDFHTNRQQNVLHSMKDCLERKIDAARLCARYITSDVRSRQGAVNLHDDVQDMRLLQHLILEHLEPVRRYAMRKVFSQANEELIVFSGDENQHYIDFFEWALIWTVLILSWAFALSWIFRWAVVSNQIAVNAWFITFSISFVQEMFIFMTFEAWFVFVYGIELARTHLEKIKSHLCEISLRKMNTTFSADDTEDVRLVQHFSPACRAARTTALLHLPSSQLLMRLDDVDVVKLRECSTHKSPSVIFKAISLFLECLPKPWIQDLVLNLLLPILWSGFISAWYLLYKNERLAFSIVVWAVSASIVLYGLCEYLKFVKVIPGKISEHIFGAAGTLRLSGKPEDVWRSTMRASGVDDDDDDDDEHELLFVRASKWKHGTNKKNGWKVENRRLLEPLPLLDCGKHARLKVPSSVLTLRLSKWKRYFESDQLEESLLLQQYTGGSAADLLKLHVQTTAKIAKIHTSWIAKKWYARDFFLCDLEAALGYASALFDRECYTANTNIHELNEQALVRISSQLWRNFSVDGAFLSSQEWSGALSFLLHEIGMYESASLSKEQYVDVIARFVCLVREDRHRDFAASVARTLPPPAVGPLPIPSFNLKEEVVQVRPSELVAPTSDLRIALRRLKTKFQQIDVFNTDSLSVNEVLKLCIWIWSIYHPGGTNLSQLERDEMNAQLFAKSMRIRRREFLSLVEFTDWLVACDVMLSGRRREAERRQALETTTTLRSVGPPVSPSPIPTLTLSLASSPRTRIDVQNSDDDDEDDDNDDETIARLSQLRVKVPSFFDAQPEHQIRRSNREINQLDRILPGAMPMQSAAFPSIREFTRPASPGAHPRPMVLLERARATAEDSFYDEDSVLVERKSSTTTASSPSQTFALNLSGSTDDDVVFHQAFAAAPMVAGERDLPTLSLPAINLEEDSASESDSGSVSVSASSPVLAVALKRVSEESIGAKTKAVTFSQPLQRAPVRHLPPVILDSDSDSDSSNNSSVASSTVTVSTFPSTIRLARKPGSAPRVAVDKVVHPRSVAHLSSLPTVSQDRKARSPKHLMLDLDSGEDDDDDATAISSQDDSIETLFAGVPTTLQTKRS